MPHEDQGTDQVGRRMSEYVLDDDCNFVECVRFTDISLWKQTMNSESENYRTIESIFSASRLYKYGWTVFTSPRQDDPTKLNTWVTYQQLVEFGNMISTSTGIRMPPFQKERYNLDITGLEYFDVKSKADYKQIGRALREAKRIDTARATYDQAREQFESKPALYVALDFEQWEQDHSKVTEFGISTFDTSLPKVRRDIITRHILIEEVMHLKNGRYVPDNAMNFRHGVTETLPFKDAVLLLQELILSRPASEIVLIFHDSRGDLQMMQSMNLTVPEACRIFDTRSLFAKRQSSPKGLYSSLGKMLDQLGILAFHLHNAGNDADGTLRAFIAMCTEHHEASTGSRLEQ